MDPTLAKLFFSVFAWLIAISFGAGGVYLAVRRNTGDIEKLNGEAAKSRAELHERIDELVREVNELNAGFARLEERLASWMRASGGTKRAR